MQTLLCEELPSLGRKYPIGIDCYAPTGEDRSLCDRLLSKESLKLFQKAGGGIDVLWSARDNGSRKLLCQQVFVASEEIEKHGIHQETASARGVMAAFNIRLSLLTAHSIIQPVFSWSHLSITEPAFRKILASLQVFTPFLRVVHAFGKKTSDKQRARDLVYHRMQPSSAYEFCYNIRYFELNGRGRGNPWSLRQTGVYQRCLSNNRSTWLLLNFSSYIIDRVSAALQEENNSIHGSREAPPLSPHLFIASAATRNWEPYIEDLRRKVRIFEEKAYSTRIDEKYLGDYELLFSDVQEMMSLGDTIAVATTIITGQRDILSKCSDLHTMLGKKRSGQRNCDMASTLRALRADLQHHHEAVTSLARTASKTTQLELSAILATRANDNLRATMATIQTGMAGLRLQSGQTCLDTGRLLRVTTQGHRDATTIKILTHIATMFLPASLIASLFNSAIFGNPSHKISYVALYLAITIPLLLATLLFLILLEKGLPRDSWLRRLSRSRA